MKRLGLLLGALGLVGFSAFASGSVEAQAPSYPPGPNPTLEAVPDQVAQNAPFDAVVTGCFPGETVTFYNFELGESDQAVCADITYTASVTFQAPADLGSYFIFATIPALDSDDPDVPDLPARGLLASYTVVPAIDLGVTGLAGGDGAGPTFTSTSGSVDPWPGFLSSAGFYRTFLALLALMAGVFFVWLWRRRREDEQQAESYVGGRLPPPGSSTPTLA